MIAATLSAHVTTAGPKPAIQATIRIARRNCGDGREPIAGCLGPRNHWATGLVALV